MKLNFIEEPKTEVWTSKKTFLNVLTIGKMKSLTGGYEICTRTKNTCTGGYTCGNIKGSTCSTTYSWITYPSITQPIIVR